MRKGNVLAALMVFLLLVPAAVYGARFSEPEELDRLVRKISERQSKDMKTFEKKTRAYFFEEQKPETIAAVIKQVAPGEAITVIVLSNLSKKPAQEIIAMKKAGKTWQEIADNNSVKLKAVVKDVKDFRLGIG
jgi:G:T/U-mismatch repair DNA glycosylase